MANVQEGPFMRIKAVETGFGFSIGSDDTLRKWSRSTMEQEASLALTGFRLAYGSNNFLYAIDDVGNISRVDPAAMTVQASRDFAVTTGGLCFGYDGNVYLGVDDDDDFEPEVVYKLDANDLSTLGSVSLKASAPSGTDTEFIMAITHVDGFAYAACADFTPSGENELHVFRIDASTMSVTHVLQDDAHSNETANGIPPEGGIIHDDAGHIFTTSRSRSEAIGQHVRKIRQSDLAMLAHYDDGDEVSGHGITWSQQGRVYVGGSDLSELDASDLSLLRSMSGFGNASGLQRASDGHLYRGRGFFVDKIDISGASLSDQFSHGDSVRDVAIDESIPDQIPIPSA